MPLGALAVAALEQAARVGITMPMMGRHAAGRSEARVLESSLRRQIVDIIREEPGIAIGGLLEKLPVGWGTVYHHLSKLERGGVVRCVTSGRRRLLYLVEQGAAGQDPHQRSLLGGHTTRTIASIVAEGQGMSIEAIVEQSHETPRVVYYHLKRLIEAGLVQSESATRYRGLMASDRLRELLAEQKSRTP